MAQATCPACSVEFEPRNGNQRYCSTSCKAHAATQLRTARNAGRERNCARCGATFSDPSRAYCRPCANDVQRDWRQQNPQRRAAHKRKSVEAAAQRDPNYYRKLTLRKFGLTLETYDALVEKQFGRCAICNVTEPGGRHGTWHIDHDRSCCPKMWSCGSCVRGLLCQNCNILLGHAHDDTAILLAAIDYLKR